MRINEKNWAEEFNRLSDEAKSGNYAAMYKVAEMRREIFQDTIDIVSKGGYDVGENSVELESFEDLIRNSRFYEESFSIAEGSFYDTIISVENVDCLLAGLQMQEEGYNPAVLNMANRQNPGGGVINGAGAQEENIFRRSNLFKSLFQFAYYAEEFGIERSRYQYPMDKNFGGVYSQDVTVFRGLEEDGYPLLEVPYCLSVITVAGVNNPPIDGQGRMVDSAVEGLKNKIRTILRIGIENKHDSLVLSALGCGAFRNPPEQVAELFRAVLGEAEFKNRFRKIVFAILEDHNSGHKHNRRGNFQPFFDEFCEVES